MGQAPSASGEVTPQRSRQPGVKRGPSPGRVQDRWPAGVWLGSGSMFFGGLMVLGELQGAAGS